MTTTAEQCIAAIDLNAYRHERSCHNLINLLLPARLYASQGGSCVKPTDCSIAPGTVVLRMLITPTAITTIILAVEKKCDVIM